MKRHETLEMEKLAAKFHRMMGWVSLGVGVLSGVYTLSMFAQAYWHFKGEDEHEEEIEGIEQRLADLRTRMNQEADAGTSDSAARIDVRRFDEAQHRASQARSTMPFTMPTRTDPNTGQEVVDVESCPKA